MEDDNGVLVEVREKQADQQRCPHADGNELGLTSRLKSASRSSESFLKANPAQSVGAAVLTGGLALALYMLKRRKPPGNKRIQSPPASPQAPLAWHWESFKEKYKADDDDSCSASCDHLKAVQAVAKKKDEATCQELHRLGVLQFLIDEMKGHSAGPQFLHGALPGSILPRRTTARSKSPSPDRIPGRLNSLKSPGGNKPGQHLRHGIRLSPDKPFKSVSRSPIPRVPTLSTMEETDSQAEAADRGGNVHVPASAPTSSAHSSPRLSARRALSLAPSPVANPSPIVSPSKQPLAPLPPQSPPNNPRETRFKQSVGQTRPDRQSSGGFCDENRPVRGLGCSDSPGLGELPAGFQPCGDLNEDVEQWEGHEKEHGPPDDDASTTYSTEDPDSCATSSRASPRSQGPTSPCRASPSPKPLRSRVSGVPPLSGQRSLAPASMLAQLPATPLRKLLIVSPDRELHQGRIYRHTERHLLMVQLALEMLLTGSGDLDPVYMNSMSEVQHLSVIQQHLSTDRNACMTVALEAWAAQAGEPIMRLLRLTSSAAQPPVTNLWSLTPMSVTLLSTSSPSLSNPGPSTLAAELKQLQLWMHLFNAEEYRDRCQIARGAFSEVYTCSCCKQGRAASQLALKVSDLPSESRQNERAQITAFTEVGVMQRLAHVPGICKLHDYGINRQGIYLVMTQYSCSLRAWLAKQKVKPSQRLRLYMQIFCQLAELLKAVAAQEVVHFDLKCDNILLEALPGTSQQEFWAPSTDRPPFKLVLADFGDSCDFSLAEHKFTTRSLGTESNQPPEMLVSKESGARRQFGKLPVITGSSTPSDVWSLGCLLFELFTGNLLYPDSEDFSKFFSMLTGMSDEVLLSPDRLQPVEHMPAVVDLLGFILVRDPNMRPTAGAVAERVKAILQTI